MLEGELPIAELELGVQDAMVKANEPLHYQLETQLLDDNLLVRGRIQLTLDCECVRCLKPFKYSLEMKDWVCHLALEGEEKVAVVDDSVDLTGPLREDILLAFPAHPVCDPGCVGLTGKSPGAKQKQDSGPTEAKPSAWEELDKLKFRS